MGAQRRANVRVFLLTSYIGRFKGAPMGRPATDRMGMAGAEHIAHVGRHDFFVLSKKEQNPLPE